VTVLGRAGGALLALLLLGGCTAVHPSGRPAGNRAATASPATSAALPTATPTTTPTTTPTATPTPADAWRPAPGTTWQYQLSGDLDLSVDAEVYDVDWQETTAAQVAELHRTGRRVVCYLNAGAHEQWRPDAADYAADVLGKPLDGWPGERWVDVRRLDVLLPLVSRRMDICAAKGFDAVEPDNVDGYANETGFPLTAADQLAFNTAVASLAHERGLSVGLKNDVEQVGALEPVFDFAVNEECLVYDECAAYRPFIDAGKAVLHVEYAEGTPRLCEAVSPIRLSSILKNLDLDAALRHC
jgi:hypothetical protein